MKMETRTTTRTVYHGTTRERADAILAGGFSLNQIKTRWMNDLAVSALTSEGAVRRYFGKHEKVVLRLKVRGRWLRLHSFERGPVEHAANARDYTRRMVDAGVDAIHMDGGLVYVYNPDAIQSIEEVA
jgi:hypothetical protein